MIFRNVNTICPILLFIIVMSLVIINKSAFSQQLIWQQMFDTGVVDFSEAVAIDMKGNIIVVGTTILEQVQPPNREDFLIVKYNSLGDTLWTRQYHFSEADEAYGVATDKFDNIIIVGSIKNDSTNFDMHVLKYDPNGNTIWSRTYSNGENIGEFGYGVAVDSKNNIIVTGKTNATATLLGAFLTLKYDSSGNLLWMQTYDGGWEDYAQDVAVDKNDNIIVTGYSDSDINWDWCTIKYSPNGDTLWIRRCDVTLTDWAFGVTTDLEGNVIVVGDTHQLLPETGGASGMVVKYTPEGDTLWTKIYTDTLHFAEVSKFVDVTTDDEGNIFLAGDYVCWQDGKRWIDYYVAKWNPQGDTIWTRRYNYDREDEASGIDLNREGSITITGTTNSSPERYEYNYLTIKIQNSIVGIIDENPSISGNFILYQNYPNPFNPSTTISYTLPYQSDVEIIVYDILGREVKNFVMPTQLVGLQNVLWDGKNNYGVQVSSGVYLYRISIKSLENNQTFVKTAKLMMLK